MAKSMIQDIKDAYIKLYGNKWKEKFTKYYWSVYDGETGECKHINLESIKKCVEVNRLK